MTALLIVLAVVAAVLVYVAVAFAVFGGATCGGDPECIRRSDYIWAALWPLYWVRIVGWKIRWWGFKTHIWRHEYNRLEVLGVPTQRIDQWLIALGEDINIRLSERIEKRREKTVA